MRFAFAFAFAFAMLNLHAANYYWVGGTGNWNDNTHWATSSGGSTFYATPPTENDDVFLDENSFNTSTDTIYISPGSIAYTHIFDATAIVETVVIEMLGNSAELDVYKDLRLNENIQFYMNSDFLFPVVRLLGITNHNLVRSSGALSNVRLRVSGPGDYQVVDDTLRLRSLQVESGRFVCEEKTIIAEFSVNALGGNFVIKGTDIFVGINEDGQQMNLGLVSIVFDSLHHADEATNITGKAKMSSLDIRVPGYFDSIRIGHVEMEGLCYPIGLDRSVSIRRVNMRDAALIGANGHIDTLLLTHGNTYAFQGSSPFRPGLNIKKIIAEGDCQSPLFLTHGRLGYFEGGNYMSSSEDQELFNVILDGVEVFHDPDDPRYAGRWRAYDSYISNTENIETITTAPPRTLYRLAGNAEWYDPAYWSLTDGGPGGECIPRPNDVVIFNNNSFQADGDSITSFIIDSIYTINTTGDMPWLPLPLFCGDIIWEQDYADIGFIHPDLRIHGSSTFNDRIDYQIDKTNFLGLGNHTIRSNGVVLNDLEILTYTGRYTLLDQLEASPLSFFKNNAGDFVSGGHDIIVGAIGGYTQDPDHTFDLSGSDVYLSGREFGVASENFLFKKECEQCFFDTMNLENTTFYGFRSDAPIYLPNRYLGCNIIYPDSSYRANIIQYDYRANMGSPDLNRISLAGDGRLVGRFFLDSLHYTPGRIYEHRAPRDITVREYFDARGNSCRPITIQPWRNNNLFAKLILPPEAEIFADYLILDRVKAITHLPAYLGPNSRMFSSDQPADGIAFTYQPGRTPFSLSPGFLGRDTVICTPDPPLLLEPDEYLAPPALDYTYNWENNSPDTFRQLSTPGEYALDLTFIDQTGQYCTLGDSLKLRIASFEPTDWFPDYEVAMLNCATDTNGVILVYLPDSLDTYTLDGQLPDTILGGFSGLSAGTYALSVEGPLGCPVVDSVNITAPDAIQSDLPETINIEAGEQSTISVNVSGGRAPYQYNWTVVNPVDSSSLGCTNCPRQLFRALVSGVYNLEITDANGCVYGESIFANVYYNRRDYLPTAFSPNFDGINDRLTVFGRGNLFRVEDFKVFNRWGDLVYSTKALLVNDPTSGWDGVANGKPAEAGSYAVSYTVIWQDGLRQKRKGVVTLLR